MIGRPNSNWSFFPFFLFFFFFFISFFFTFTAEKEAGQGPYHFMAIFGVWERKTGFYFNRIATCAVRWGRRKQTVKWYMMISISRSGRFFRWKMFTLIFFLFTDYLYWQRREGRFEAVINIYTSLSSSVAYSYTRSIEDFY